MVCYHLIWKNPTVYVWACIRRRYRFWEILQECLASLVWTWSLRDAGGVNEAWERVVSEGPGHGRSLCVARSSWFKRFWTCLFTLFDTLEHGSRKRRGVWWHLSDFIPKWLFRCQLKLWNHITSEYLNLLSHIRWSRESSAHHALCLKQLHKQSVYTVGYISVWQTLNNTKRVGWKMF